MTERIRVEIESASEDLRRELRQASVSVKAHGETVRKENKERLKEIRDTAKAQTDQARTIQVVERAQTAQARAAKQAAQTELENARAAQISARARELNASAANRERRSLLQLRYVTGDVNRRMMFYRNVINLVKVWQPSHWRSLLHNYQSTPYFDLYRDVFEP